jgi:hypothetical protein
MFSLGGFFSPFSGSLAFSSFVGSSAGSGFLTCSSTGFCLDGFSSAPSFLGVPAGFFASAFFFSTSFASISLFLIKI